MNDQLNDGTKLYSTKNCCGCGACEFVCPRKAISMQYDESGNLYPSIDQDRCISCELCKKNCAFQNTVSLQYPINGYAVVNNNSEQLGKSASGGAFSCVASKVINNGFYICGSVMKYEDDIYAEHIITAHTSDIEAISGSKYAQSSLRKIYAELAECLKNKKNVLFCGTPCQVAQIRRMFAKYSENLYTIDLICHGAPSAKRFSDYTKIIEKKYKGKIDSFIFRDKSFGWGKYGSVSLKRGKKSIKICLPQEKSSYYSLFMSGDLQRENCFNCPYARVERCSDLTIGDYWGIEKYAPDLLKCNGGQLDENNGISAALINTEKGRILLDEIDAKIFPTEISNIVNGNSQLRESPRKGKMYRKINDIYTRKGYLSVDRYFEVIRIKRVIKNHIKKLLGK